MLLNFLTIRLLFMVVLLILRQLLFCCQQHLTFGGYFAVRHLWMVNFNDILNVCIVVVSDW